jgi:uncharacterized protein
MLLRRFDATLTRATVRGRTLTGHAAVFGQVATVPEGIEGLTAGAFDGVLANPSTDVRALWNHDPTLLLGRQGAGTLTLDVDDDGLTFEVPLPNTSYAEDLRELVKRGDLDGASFGFVPGESHLERSEAGTVRWHTAVAQLVDVSPVTFPAYAGAGTQLRAWVPGAPIPARPSGLRGATALLRHRVRTERP